MDRARDGQRCRRPATAGSVRSCSWAGRRPRCSSARSCATGGAHRPQLEQRARDLEHTREEEARRRVAEERLRIARDLHDGVAHAMATINVQAGAAAHVVDRRPEAAAGRARGHPAGQRRRARRAGGAARPAARRRDRARPHPDARASPRCRTSWPRTGTTVEVTLRDGRRARRRCPGPVGAAAVPHRAGGAHQRAPPLRRAARHGVGRRAAVPPDLAVEVPDDGAGVDGRTVRHRHGAAGHAGAGRGDGRALRGRRRRRRAGSSCGRCGRRGRDPRRPGRRPGAGAGRVPDAARRRGRHRGRGRGRRRRGSARARAARSGPTSC